jgi:hypothetical protein
MRSGFEAADCGILIWRERAPLLLLSFAVPAIIAATIVYTIVAAPLYHTLGSFSVTFTSGGLFSIKTWRYICTAVILWWFKPLFDRFALQTISKLFFNKKVAIKEIALSFFPDVLRGLFGDLTWRRFSPLRGATLPIRMLERQKMKTFKSRKETLLNGGLSFTVFLTVLCPLLEIALLLGSIISIFSLVFLFDIDLTLNAGQTISDSPVVPVILALVFINFCIVETIWMAMSFAVYINSRVITEGWDLELIFNELALRKKQNE